MALCWYQDEMGLLIPLFLGIIASALAETDDSWQGRLNALAVTLVCFMVAALSVELLFPYPILFIIAFALASFCLTMLGALGERYGAIASATLPTRRWTLPTLFNARISPLRSPIARKISSARWMSASASW